MIDTNPQDLERALTEALHDEYKARATYRHIIAKFGHIRPFSNIVESEGRHIQALIRLFEKYQIPIPSDEWETQVIVPDTVQEACQQGVEAEIANQQMYEKLLAMTTAYPDVQQVFLNLQRASQENHLRAFQRCVGRSAGRENHSFMGNSSHGHCKGYKHQGHKHQGHKHQDHKHQDCNHQGRKHKQWGKKGRCEPLLSTVSPQK